MCAVHVPCSVIHDSMLEGAKGSILTEPSKYTYNRSFHPAGQPVPREFTVAFMDGWGKPTAHIVMRNHPYRMPVMTAAG